MSHPLYGNAPPEVIAEFEAAHAARVEENRRRIAAGDYGDVPQKLSEEDEAALDRAWEMLRQEEALESQPDRIAA